MSSVLRLAHGDLIDGYEILEALGEGGYAITYKVTDTTSGRLAVLKCPKPQLLGDPAVLRRHRQERRVISSLDHPGIVASLDDSAARSRPYMVLEYIDGPNLRQLLHETGGTLPVACALDYGRQLAGTLAYLHGRGITHRDLKPENVLVAADGTLKLIDFENAATGRRHRRAAFTDDMGTPDYMSPERIRGAASDAPSDVYALGLMMYEFLTGQVPFQGEDPVAVMRAHLEDSPQPIRALRPEVPIGLEAVVLTAMRRYPEHRHPTGAALLGDLDRLGTAGTIAVELSAYDLSAEPPMPGGDAIGSARRELVFAGVVTAAFIGVVALILAITIVLR